MLCLACVEQVTLQQSGPKQSGPTTQWPYNKVALQPIGPTTQ